MAAGETVQVRIRDLGIDGEGIGQTPEGMTVFVDGALPSELVCAQIYKTKKNYLRGKLAHIIEASPERIPNDCSAFSKGCGGCSLRHLRYDTELCYKEKAVRAALERIAKICPGKIYPIIGMAHPFHYRNKTVYHFGSTEQRCSYGFYKRKSNQLAPFENCLISSEAHLPILEKVRSFMEENNIPAYSGSNKKGIVKHLVIRQSGSHLEFLICLVSARPTLPHENSFVNDLKDIPGLKGIVLNINSRQSPEIFGLKNRILWGKDEITETIGEITLKLSSRSFVQINPAQTITLYTHIKQLASLTGSETVFDIFSGIGGIGLTLAKQCKTVYGIEIVQEAVENAKDNAKLNNLPNTHFVHGDACEEFKKLIGRDIKADLAVLDPPRSGCSTELLQLLLQYSPHRIIYVSCNPSTLARDLALLAQGYVVSSVQPVDMFPRTMHVETVVLLESVS